MIRRIGEWVEKMVGRLHLTSRDQILELRNQRQERLESISARARAEFRERQLRAELERLRQIQEARNGT